MSWLHKFVLKRSPKLVPENAKLFKNRSISKQEHMFLIGRIADQIRLFEEVLIFFGCLEAAEHLANASLELDELEGKISSQTQKGDDKNASANNGNSERKSGATIHQLHEEGPA